jgi:hypothetical protein
MKLWHWGANLKKHVPHKISAKAKIDNDENSQKVKKIVELLTFPKWHCNKAAEISNCFPILRLKVIDIKILAKKKKECVIML